MDSSIRTRKSKAHFVKGFTALRFFQAVFTPVEVDKLVLHDRRFINGLSRETCYSATHLRVSASNAVVKTV